MLNPKKKQFAINVGSGFLAQATFVGAGFILMPYTIWRLGAEGFGIYQLARSVLVFFMFLQLGMGPTLSRYFSQAIAKKDKDTVHKISSSAQLILCILGTLGMVVAIILIPFFLKFYEVPLNMTFETSGLLVCMAVSLFLNMVYIVPSGIVLGSNRYDLVNGLEIVANVLRVGLIVATFELFGPSVLTLGVCILTTQFFRFVVLFVFAFKNVGRSALFSLGMVDKKTLKSLLGFSSLNLVNSAAFALVLQGPILIIGKVLGAEIVTMFAPAILVASSMQGFLAQMSRPLVPMASQAQAENNTGQMGQWSIIISSSVASVGLAIVLPLCVFGHEIIGLWLGQDMSHIWTIIAVMALGTVVSQTAGVNYFMALGGGNILPTVYSQIFLGVIVSCGVAIGTKFFQWQLINVALFIVTCQCFRNVFYLTYAYSKQFCYQTSRYLLAVYGKPLFVFSTIAGIGYLLKIAIVPDFMVLLLIEIVGVLILYGTIVWCFFLPLEIKVSLRKLLSAF